MLDFINNSLDLKYYIFFTGVSIIYGFKKLLFLPGEGVGSICQKFRYQVQNQDSVAGIQNEKKRKAGGFYTSQCRKKIPLVGRE